MHSNASDSSEMKIKNRFILNLKISVESVVLVVQIPGSRF